MASVVVVVVIVAIVVDTVVVVVIVREHTKISINKNRLTQFPYLLSA